MSWVRTLESTMISQYFGAGKHLQHLDSTPGEGVRLISLFLSGSVKQGRPKGSSSNPPHSIHMQVCASSHVFREPILPSQFTDLSLPLE